eukprot:Opistho-2@70857
MADDVLPPSTGRHVRFGSINTVSYEPNEYENEALVIRSSESVAKQRTARAQSEELATGRLVLLDAVRGLLMILMALDHASALVAHVHPNEAWDGVTPYASTALGRLEFATRYATVACAPGFALLMGMGMVYYTKSRHKLMWAEGRILRHHLLRAVFMIIPCMTPFEILSFSLATYIWPSLREFHNCYVYVGVLWALSTSTCIGAVAMRFLASAPRWARIAVHFALGAGALLLTGVIIAEIDEGDSFNILVRLLVVPGQSGYFYVAFPTIPWAGFVLFGCALAEAVGRSELRFVQVIAASLVGLIPAFVVVRIVGSFGNMVRIPHSDSPFSSHNKAIDFLNVVKYPPSIVFALLSLSTFACIVLVLWLLSHVPPLPSCHSRTRSNTQHEDSDSDTAPLLEDGERTVNRSGSDRDALRACQGPYSGILWRPLLVFGRAPLFFYVCHAVFFCIFSLPGDPHGLPFWAVFPFWACGICVLYWPTKKYGDFKRRTHADSLWRLF